MARVHRLTLEPMTEETFAPFGELWDPQDRPADHRIIARTTFEHDGRATVGVVWQPYAELTFNELERHYGVSQSFVQLAGPPAVVCAAAPTNIDDPMDVPNPEDVHAFLINPAKGWCFKRGTWHSLNRHILAPPGSSFIIINSLPNPTQVVNYENSTGYLSRDLSADQSPRMLNYEGKFGVVFQISI